MEKLTQAWFELVDLRRRSFSRSVWIPIYGEDYAINELAYPKVGHIHELLAVGAAVIFEKHRQEAESLDWHDFSQSDTVPFVDDQGEYHLADHFPYGAASSMGFRLVLSQYTNSLHNKTVELHHDFRMAYGLILEDNHWLKPSSGYEAVARRKRDDTGKTTFIEVRSEYLRDYLAARNAALRLYYYRERRAVMSEDPGFNWPEDNSLIDDPHDRCQVRSDKIDSSGDFAGATWAVFGSWRTDVDPSEDVPDFSNSETQENTAYSSRRGKRNDTDIRFRITGEMWRGEWIEPNETTCRMGYDEPEEDLFVISDVDGKRTNLKEFNFEEVGKYLWFSPNLASTLIARRGGHLEWYTSETGGISASPETSPVHFGVNHLGLITVYAYDVARLPLWQRRLWVAQNLSPDGGVSAELLEAQMRCRPAATKAAEFLLDYAIDWIETAFQEKYSVKIFRDHDELSTLQSSIHRFRATDRSGLLALAKDMVKLTIERIEKRQLLNVLQLQRSDLGTLKLLEQIWAKHTDQKYAKASMAPLFGLYDLRLADAHLSASDLNDCYLRLGIDSSANLVSQAETLIKNVANTFGTAGTEIKNREAT